MGGPEVGLNSAACTVMRRSQGHDGELMRLLVVEDSLRLQQLLADALRREGYEVDSVATVAELSAAPLSCNTT